MSFASQVQYSRLTDLDEDDGSSVLDIKPMEKADNFSFDTIFTYDESQRASGTGASHGSKKYHTEKNTFNSVFKYNNMTAIFDAL